MRGKVARMIRKIAHREVNTMSWQKRRKLAAVSAPWGSPHRTRHRQLKSAYRKSKIAQQMA